MSAVQKSVVSALKVVESRIRCTTYYWDEGELLTPSNQKFIRDVYTLMSCLWYDISVDPSLVNRRWVTALSCEPIHTVYDLFKETDSLLIKQECCSYSDFKRRIKSVYPSSGQILSPLSGNIRNFFSSGEGLRDIRTGLLFMTRANFPDQIFSEESAFDDWQETCLTPWRQVDVTEEQQIITSWFPRRKSVVQLPDFIGRFGPGSSADCLPFLEAKYYSFGKDPKLTYLGNKVGFPPTDMPYCRDSLQRTGKLHFVPKQMNKPRTVSMEPATLMFYQLGIFRFIDQAIRSNPELRRHIDFSQVDLNKDLAWMGSLDKSYCTIDLSHASDSVTNQLVRTLFRNSCLREALICSRSDAVEYNGQVFKPEYFAPMGSGCCFPIETLVFASIVKKVELKRREKLAWRIFGDDIIAPDNWYDEIATRLVELGFKLNEDKSYHGCSSFRESCGGDYFNGEDVRPTMLSRFWTGLNHGSRSSTHLIESNIDLANRLYRYKYARLRVIESLSQLRPRVLFTANGEKGLFSSTTTNYDKKSRWNVDWQVMEYYAGKSAVRYDCTTGQDDRVRYFETLRVMAANPSCDDRMPLKTGAQRPSIWVGDWQQSDTDPLAFRPNE